MTLVKALCESPRLAGKEKQLEPLIDELKDSQKVQHLKNALASLEKRNMVNAAEKLADSAAAIILHEEIRLAQLEGILEGYSDDSSCALLIGEFVPLENDKLDNFIGAVADLNERNMLISAYKLIEKTEEIFAHDSWRVYQLAACCERFSCDAACDIFIDRFIPNMDKNILWEPFVDKLAEYDEKSVTAIMLFGNEFDEYIQEWDSSVAMAHRAVHEYGLQHLGTVEMGRDMPIEIGKGQAFFTVPDGTITIPPYQNKFETVEENMLNYKISYRHELGHHMWQSFVVNMHPDVFDYGEFGARFVSPLRNGAVVGVKGELREVRNFGDIMELVAKPELLQMLHNVVDDGRVDANNIMRYPYLADDYRENVLQLLARGVKLDEMGPEQEVDKLHEVAVVLEAVSQYATAGQLNGELPEFARERFLQCKEIIDSMEMGFGTDGTSSLNCAIRLYSLFEKEVEGLKLPAPIHNSKTSAHGSKLIVKKRKKGVPGKPGLNPDKKPFSEPGQAKAGKTEKPSGKRKTYDGYTEKGYTKDEHVIDEVPAKGEIVRPDEFQVQRIRSIFKKYAPRQGVLVRGLDEGEIDPELFQNFVDNLRVGIIDDMDYHSEVVYEERDVATAVLVDCSGSMEDVMKQVLEACGDLGTASEVLNDPLIVAGCTTGGSSGELVIMMKDIKEREIRSPGYSGGTPLGGPIRHMAHRMGEPGIKHKGFKQMFIITDGHANVGESPVEDAKKAVEENWKLHRIKTFAIGITGTDEASEGLEKSLERVFGFGRYLVVTERQIENGMLHVFFEKYYRKTVNKLR